MFQTFQTKMKNYAIAIPNENVVTSYGYFEAYARFFSMLERKLFVDLYVRKRPLGVLKKVYCATYNITSRQYNSIKNQLDGRVKAKIALQTYEMENIADAIAQTNKLLDKKTKQKQIAHTALLKMKGNEKSFLKKVRKYRNLRNHIHQKKRKLHRLELKLADLQHDDACGIIRLCFGSKRLGHN